MTDRKIKIKIRKRGGERQEDTRKGRSEKRKKMEKLKGRRRTRT